MSELHIDSVTKSYSGKVVLSDVYLNCKPGEVKGLIGRNGSGKSTLLKIIFGTEKPDFKFIRADNKIIKNVTDRSYLINYLPQENFLPNNTSIKTLISLFLDKKSRKIVLENEYVRPLLRKKNQHLSGGEKRIIEILLIIHSQAKYILLDEPFNGLSPIMRDYIIDYINKNKTSKGFIITDHDYTNIIKLADNLVYLDRGYLKTIDKNELSELGYLPV
ncbi:MAG: ABC transporter ATP-binding protein [Flavobacteriaceae bacterium]|nr:ABC transporter ATP-binding protein [Flavobacteriaceae bacterium]|tara:strand:+ start:3639 stop:4292 length:654 start_codon:yes stop_codon:yes gene_type:complete